MDATVTAKLGGLAIILFTSSLLGLLPFGVTFLLTRRRSIDGSSGGGGIQLAISCLQCLGGGVLMATVFTHMLPEVRESLDMELPLAEILLCAGMFTIYAIEEAVTLGVKRSQTKTRTHHHGGTEQSASYNADAASTSPATTDDNATTPRNYGAIRDLNTDPEKNIHPDSSASDISDPTHTGHGHSHLPPSRSAGSFRVMMIALALSVHSVFDGLAIGLEASATSAWTLVVAITTHKSIISFCLGEQLASSSQPPRHAIITLLIFLSATPLGIAIGLCVTTSGNISEGLLPAVLQALAAGTILYVVMFEIIVGERDKPGNGLLKLLAILVGFALMLTLSQLIREPEDGD